MANVDAQYVIDIAASMPDGESTIAELDSLTAKLTGAGKNAEFFQAAIKKASADLAVAASASAAAATALSEGNAKYTDLERAAAQASRQVEKLGKTGDLMSREYVEAAQKAHAAAVAVDEQANTLRGLEKSAEAAAKEEDKLAQTFDNVKKLSGHADKSIAGQAESLEKLSSGIGAIPGPVGQMGRSLIQPIQGFAKLSGSIGGSNAASLLAIGAFAALAVAIVAVSVALVAGAVKLAVWAVGLADTARAAGLASDAFNTLNPEVSFLGPKIDELAGSTAVAKNDLQGLAKSLSDAGVETDRLSDALEAAALAESAGGKEASSKYIALEKAAADAQKAVDDFAEKSGGAVDKNLTEKLEEAQSAASGFAQRSKALRGIVDKQLLGMGNQSKKLEKNFNELFSGLNIDPVLEGMRVLVDLFDKNTEAGRAMQAIFENVFQPLIDQAQNAAYGVEAFVLGFLIGMTKVYLAVKPAIKAVSELFGFEDTKLSDVLDVLAGAGEIAAYVFAGFLVVVGALGLVFGAAVAAVGLFVASFVAIPALIGEAITAVHNMIVGAVKAIIAFFTETDWTSLGTNMIQGMINGVTAMVGKLVGAVTGAVGSAIGAAKGLLGIASPSKVFENFGDMTGEGFVQGVEAQNDNAQNAMTEMVEPEVPAQPFAGVTSANTGGASAPATSEPVASGGGASASTTVAGNTFNFYGVKDAEHAQELFEESLTRLFKGDAAKLGNGLEEKAA